MFNYVQTHACVSQSYGAHPLKWKATLCVGVLEDATLCVGVLEEATLCVGVLEDVYLRDLSALCLALKLNFSHNDCGHYVVDMFTVASLLMKAGL